MVSDLVLGSNAYYFTLVESCKWIFSIAFLSGLFCGYFGRGFEVFSNFLFNLFRKYLRLRRIKRRLFLDEKCKK